MNNGVFSQRIKTTQKTLNAHSSKMTPNPDSSDIYKTTTYTVNIDTSGSYALMASGRGKAGYVCT